MQKKKIKEKIKSVYREISYVILPFFIFVMVLIVSYFGNQLIYSLGWTHGSNWCEIELDKHIPLIPWFVYFYYLTFPLGIITFFMLAYKDKKAFYNLFLTLIISFAISGVIYVFFSNRIYKVRFHASNLHRQTCSLDMGIDKPYQLFSISTHLYGTYHDNCMCQR